VTADRWAVPTGYWSLVTRPPMDCPDHARFMRLAIAAARTGIAAGQSPYGACVVRDGTVIASAHNTVLRDCDPSAHAEVNAIRAAGRALGQFDLSGCTIYATGEPCTMCFACCHWAHIATIVFGTRCADSDAIGFGELHYDNTALAKLARRPLQVVGEVLRDECLSLFEGWRAGGVPTTY